MYLPALMQTRLGVQQMDRLIQKIP
jgi:hypothetical protein